MTCTTNAPNPCIERTQPGKPGRAAHVKHWVHLKATTCAYLVAICLGLPSVASAQESPRIKMPAEKLIADLPPPRPTEKELAEPCVHNSEASTESESVQFLLTSRRAYTLAIDVWGVKWFPKHVANPRYRWMGLCTDEVFVLKQFKKAIDQPMTGEWTETDVRRLVELVERRALELVESGELGTWILEPAS